MEKVMELLKTDPPSNAFGMNDGAASDADKLKLDYVHFFYSVGMVSMCPKIKKLKGKYSWEHLGGDSWCCEAATAATFMDVATTRDNIIHNIRNKGDESAKKKKSKMITKGMWPALTNTFGTYYREFLEMIRDEQQVEKLKKWEKKIGIYNEQERSHAQQRSDKGPHGKANGEEYDQENNKRVSGQAARCTGCMGCGQV